MAGSPVQVGTLALQTGGVQLKGVVVTGQAAMSVQKGDTTQYNARAFKTNPDATSGDLIEKMPGVSRGADGKLQAQGENVTQVLVDGKPFFGTDPDAVLKNLPAEMVDKVEVFDQRSEQSRFSGFDDGNTTKTVNIVTKIEFRNGTFGRVVGGAGPERYKASGNLNKFKGDQRVSVLAQSNNVNEQNFGTEDLLGVVGNSNQGGGGRGGRGGGNSGGGNGGNAGDFLVNQNGGITATNAAGLNYSNNWNKQTELSSSYFFNRANNSLLSTTQRYYVLPSQANTTYSQIANANSLNMNHRFNMRLEHKIDSANSILFRPRFSSQSNDANSQVDGITRRSGEEQSRINSAYRANNTGLNTGGDLLLRHRFAKVGRTASLSMRGQLQPERRHHPPADHQHRLGPRQPQPGQHPGPAGRQHHRQPGPDGSPVAQRPAAGQLHHQLRPQPLGQVHLQRAGRQQPGAERGPEQCVRQLLPHAVGRVHLPARHAQGAGRRGPVGPVFRAVQRRAVSAPQHRALLLRAGAAQRQRQRALHAAEKPAPVLPHQHQRAQREPAAGRGEQLQSPAAHHRQPHAAPGIPAVAEHALLGLQPRSVEQFLRPAVGLLQFQPDFEPHPVAIRDTTVTPEGAPPVRLPAGAQLTQPTNLNYEYSVRSLMSYGRPIKALKTNVNLSANASYSESPGIVNGGLNYARSPSFGAGLTLSSNISPDLDFTVSTTSNQNYVINTLQTRLNTNYFSQVSRARVGWIVGPGINMATDLVHQYYAGLSAGYNQPYALWNASIGKKLFPGQRGEIKVYAFDLLGQNRSIQRNVNSTYYEDVNTTILQRYFMLMFTYNIRSGNVIAPTRKKAAGAKAAAARPMAAAADGGGPQGAVAGRRDSRNVIPSAAEGISPGSNSLRLGHYCSEIPRLRSE